MTSYTVAENSAFPRTDEATQGLTKREYFAAMALQGLLAGEAADARVPEAAVEIADALIAALNKEPKTQ